MSAKERKEVNVLCYILYTMSHGTGLHAMLCYSSRQLLLKDKNVVCLVYDLSSLMCVLGVFQGSEVDEQHFPSRWAMYEAQELLAASLWTTCHSHQSLEYKAPHSILLTFHGPFLILTMTKC